MNKLYEITNNFVELMDKVETGKITEEEYNKLGEELALELKNKSENLIGFAKDLEMFIDGAKTEEKRIAELRKSAENKLERFKEYVKTNMEVLGVDKVQTGIGTLSISKNPISVEIVDEDKIPAEYKSIVQTIKVDKKAIADNFKATGELIEGVKINAENTSLRIK